MAADAMMPGPDGVEVRCYRRSARQVRSGDWLPEHGRYALTDAVTDDDGRHWVTLSDTAGDWSAVSDDDVVTFTRRGKVWLYRQYRAPDWMAAAVESYRAARDAREALRESGQLVPTSVPGVAGSSVAMYQLERADFDAAVPAPRLADFVRDAAAARREPVSA